MMEEILMFNIFEGMKAGDLKGLIMPTISVDEYESKVSDNAIVFGFFVHDEDAAIELNRFIQRSAIKILDSDVSPAPDQFGYYMVFVEFMNDDDLFIQFDNMMDDVKAISAIDEWVLKPRKFEKQQYSHDTFRKLIAKINSTHAKIEEFFHIVIFLN